MAPKSTRSLVSALAAALVLLTVRAAHADEVIIWQNSFESADTCAWTTTVLAATCDPEMVFVPAGSFTMGSTTGLPDEAPVHTPDLSAYWIDRNDVTVNEYAARVSAAMCSAPDGSYSDNSFCNSGSPRDGSNPINCVDWNQATAYCTWTGKRLPTEAEWEKAARGTDARTYPWGEATPTCDYAVMFDANAGGAGCGLSSTWPVGSKPAGASPYGALDMAGNVLQWVSDWFNTNYYSVSPSTDPLGPATGSDKSLRGGSWGYNESQRSSGRSYIAPSFGYFAFGFRCAKDG